MCRSNRSCLRSLFQFQSTSSEEDVVSVYDIIAPLLRNRFNPRPPKRTLCHPCQYDTVSRTCGFNPRPPKRTLCQDNVVSIAKKCIVSIHVLRRGRCVLPAGEVNPHGLWFQSTSSEEDVVSRDCIFLWFV